MAKGKVKRKQAKEAENWVAANKPAPKTATYCSRGDCGAPLAGPYEQDQHNHDVHGGR